MIKIVFFGTPHYVVPIVEKINKEFRSARERGLIAVVTQPPKPAGRGNKVEYSEIDHWAHKHNLPKIYALDEIPEADIGIVASYGKIIPQTVIDKFKHGLLNIHPSLLPKYRGASPVQSTIISGDKETGLTVIKMDSKLDHGPIVSSFKDQVRDDDTTESLRDRLFLRSADFVVGLIPSYVNGKINPKAQDHEKAIITKSINKQDGYIDPVYLNKSLSGENIKKEKPLQFIKDSSFKISAEFYERFIRAMRPWPEAWTFVTIGDDRKRLKLLKSHVENDRLILDEVQLEGKSAVRFQQFKEGYPGAVFKKA